MHKCDLFSKYTHITGTLITLYGIQGSDAPVSCQGDFVWKFGKFVRVLECLGEYLSYELTCRPFCINCI